VSKLNTKATGPASLEYSTYLGGSGETGGNIIFSGIGYYAAEGLAVDALGDAYVAGFANSQDFPVTIGAYQSTNLASATGGTNVTVSKLNPTGTGLLYSTYIGGNSFTGDYSTGLVIDGQGNAYVTGFTFSLDYPTTPGAFQPVSLSSGNPETAFVSKLNPTGNSLVYSTFLGGSGEDDAYALAVDGTDDLYVAGSTGSTDFPVTSNAYQSTNKAAAESGDTAFLTELNPAGSAELYSTFLGGSISDSAYGVALGSGGAVYLTGFTGSPDFPVTLGAFETKYNSAVSTAFIAEFDLGTAPVTQATATTLMSSANPQIPGKAVTFTATVAAGSGTPAGNVVFSVDEVAVATVALDGKGQAAYLAPSLAQGQHYILASYAGNSTYASSGAGLTETIQYPQPAISSLTPFVETAGGAGFMLTVNGANYYSGARVTWGSTILTTTYVSATQLIAQVPLSLVASAGSVEVTVTSLGGMSAPSTFTILGPTTTFPLLLSLLPASTTPGGLSFMLTVNGANFATNSIVLWNGKARTTRFVSSTKLTATILGTDISTQGIDLVTVANSVPKAKISAGLPFAVQSSAAVATITGASLADTPASNGDSMLTLTGTGFVPDSTVQINGESMTTEYVSPYQISAVLTGSDYLLLPAMVTVMNPSGISVGFEVQ
jgi:hypothetical protein